MSKRLKDNISSRYFEAANKLASKKARRRIAAYVESYDDVFFWRTMLKEFENDSLYFEVMLPTRGNRLGRGKKAALMALIGDKVGRDMVACVDADYDYLLQGRTESSKTIVGNPYVFHTYAYSIENLQCYAPSLHEVSVAVTLNDRTLFDFEAFLRDFSTAVFPLFVWNVWSYATSAEEKFTITDFLKTIDIGNFNPDDTESALRTLRHKVGMKVGQLQQQHPDARESWQKVKEEIKLLGVTPQTTYLYVQGHHIFDKVVLPMMKKVCTALIRAREEEIGRQSVHRTQRQNEISCYERSVSDVRLMLRHNTDYTSAEPYRRIAADLQAFVNS